MLTIGFDPEMAIKPANQKMPVGAWHFTTGTKIKPVPANDIYQDLSLQADGVALELNFRPIDPAKEDAGDIVTSILANLTRAVAKKKMVILPGPVISGYSVEDLKHPLATAYGCDPDFNAYSEFVEMPRAFAPDASGTKYFGGHVHFGYDRALCPPHVFIKMMDAFWGIASGEYQGRRREVYGMAGLFRPKTYGVEYRTPGNSWLTSDVGYFRRITTAAQVLHEMLTRFPTATRDMYRTIQWDRVRDFINQENYRRGVDYQASLVETIAKLDVRLAAMLDPTTYGEIERPQFPVDDIPRFEIHDDVRGRDPRAEHPDLIPFLDGNDPEDDDRLDNEPNYADNH